MATNWKDPADELPPATVYVEAQTELGLVRIRYCGRNCWRTSTGEWIDAPFCWRFVPCQPGSTGHFMQPRKPPDSPSA